MLSLKRWQLEPVTEHSRKIGGSLHSTPARGGSPLGWKRVHRKHSAKSPCDCTGPEDQPQNRMPALLASVGNACRHPSVLVSLLRGIHPNSHYKSQESS